jgi:hypothetical protein
MPAPTKKNDGGNDDNDYSGSDEGYGDNQHDEEGRTTSTTKKEMRRSIMIS